MTNTFAISVSVDNVHAQDDGSYTGDFTFEQTAGSPTIVDRKGNFDLKDVSGETDITFDWASPTVEINGQEYPASYFFGDQTGNNILISEGKDSNPRVSGKHPPMSGTDEFLVDEAPSAGAFMLVDKNNDKKKYAYCMMAYINIDGGRVLVDDPKIYNKPS